MLKRLFSLFKPDAQPTDTTNHQAQPTAPEDECPRCQSARAEGASFCTACGRSLSSAGMPTQILTPPAATEEWRSLPPYTIALGDVQEHTFTDVSLAPGPIRSICIEVAYSNESQEPIKYSLGQWMLYDTDGYAYEFELINRYYQQLAEHKLQEGLLAPGRRVRGWVAFKVPPSAHLAYVQFRSGYTAEQGIEFPLT
ncbi:MAG: DUF4352 domain-containing protein [Chloroflexaceae bacterium]|nr:DUF4352 domain-containing protein [Chloroflexaceae bacterium]